jgi:hypothetical protein
MKNYTKVLGAALMLFTIVSCGDDDSESVNNLIMEMKLVHTVLQDTVVHTFSYQDSQLKQVIIQGNGINKTYTADIDGNGKITEAGQKRFEWDGDQLVKITDDNGVWIDLNYNGGALDMAVYFKYNNNNDIEKLGSYAFQFNGQNLSGIDNANPSNQVFAKYTFSGFDNKTNLFASIWWFHYVGETMGAFRSGTIPEALYTINNPGSYIFELPLQPFERIISYSYTYDEQGRVNLVEYSVGVDDYELIISY